MIRRFFSKHFFRILVWLLITLVTLVVLLYVWTNWSGRRRWAATKAMIEQKGETLDFHKLLPETPAEADNLLAIEPLAGITVAVDHEGTKGVAEAKRKALEAMKLEPKAPGSAGVERGETEDMQAWAKFLRETKYLDLPTESAAPGRDVLVGLDARFPVLKQLADLAPQRSAAMFTPGMRERELPGMLFTLSLQHYTSAQTLMRALCLRARAAIDARQGAEAARSLLAAEKLGLGCEVEPLLLGLLVSNAAKAMVNEVVWLGLREKAFAEEDLRLLYDTLKGHDLDKAMLQGFRGEMAAGLNAVEYLQDAAAGRKQAGKDVVDAFASMQGFSLNGFRALPGGLFDHWKSVIAEVEWKHILDPLRKGGISAMVKSTDALNADWVTKENYLLHPDYIMARTMVPAFSTVSASALVTQARERQVLAALALERFFLKHARYPARLQELVPEFTAAVPLDPCDGQEVRYRTTPAGRYVLWCVGFDGKDDGGQVTDSTRSLKNPKYLGDWAWQYEPVKMESRK